jgi:hypothetical protein
VQVGDDSKLTRIEIQAFTKTSLARFECPMNVNFMHTSAFADCPVKSISIDPRNRWLEMEGFFLYEIGRSHLLGVFQSPEELCIPDCVQILGRSCFQGNGTVKSIHFGADAQIRQIRDWAFTESAVESLVIPASISSIDALAFGRHPLRSVRLESGNQFYCLHKGLLCSADGLNAVRYLTGDSVVEVPRSVIAIGRNCFSNDRSISTITFESGSGLVFIAEDAFSYSYLKSICLPSSTRFVNGGAFLDCQIYHLRIEDGNKFLEVYDYFLLDRRGTRIVRYLGGSGNIVIPSHVVTIGRSSFPKGLRASITFEGDSQLRRIEGLAFFHLFIESIRLPGSVETIGDEAFGRVVRSGFSVDARNPYYRVVGDFLVDLGGTRIVRYIGHSSHLCIPRQIAVFGEWCIGWNSSVEHITFEEGSVLRRLESGACAWGSLKAISLPASVEFVDGFAFDQCDLECVTVDENNRRLVYESGCLIDRRSKTLIRAFPRDGRILIPGGISVVGRCALSGIPGAISVDFAPESSVVKICQFGFLGLSLRSLRIPASVERIHGTALRGILGEAISIEATNPYLAVQGDFIIELSTNKLVVCLSVSPTVVIPSTVEIVGKGAFEGRSVSNIRISFAANSGLLGIEKNVFGRSSVVSLTIPAKVAFLDGRTFEDSHIQQVEIARENQHFEMRGDFLVEIAGQRLIHYFGADSDIVVPSEIEILGRNCFWKCWHLTSISFCGGCGLKSIEHSALGDTDLDLFRIPVSVERIQGSAFSGWTGGSGRIAVNEGNEHFRLDGDFLLDFEGRRLIRYLGRSAHVCIGKGIEVIGVGSFYGHRQVVQCDFEEGSRLSVVEEEGFWNCLMGSITLPRTVSRIARGGFMSTCDVSVSGLEKRNADVFREWQSKHEVNASVVLNLNLGE